MEIIVNLMYNEVKMNKIVLASQSPRRKEILENVNVEFELVPSTIDEIILPEDEPKAAVMALSFEKAWDVASKVSEDKIIIGADTIVFQDTILGKPKDDADAFEMLKHLNGSSHQVYTGICIVCKSLNLKIVDVVKTTVTFKNSDDETLKKYVATGECFGKAGAYGIQGFGGLLVDKIEGDYLNVVGLPLSKLNDLLNKHFDFSML